MSTTRLTAAQAVVRYLAAQRTTIDGSEAPLFAGVWAIFGHGNVAGLGEALYQVATCCRPIARTTSRAWRTPRSRLPRRSSAAR